MLPKEPYDESDIDPEDYVIRGITKHHLVWDNDRKCHRITTIAYGPSSGPNAGMSVDIEAKIRAAGLDPKEYASSKFKGSVRLRADAVRKLDLWIGSNPLPDNPYHGEIWGNPRPNRFSKQQREGLRHIAEWNVELENVEIR